MSKEINKFHAMQLFTDTFIAETVHLTNNELGIYTRLINFHWTKNAKPFSTENAYVICQCKDDECKDSVNKILEEFFILGEDGNSWTNKRVLAEHQYLTEKYKVRSEAGKKGGLAKRENARSKNVAPIPIPSPIPNNNIYDPLFEKLWNLLSKKRGSKFKAHELWKKNHKFLTEYGENDLAEIYNIQIKDIEDDKFIPHFSTWLSQRRWETPEILSKIPDLIERLQKIGYKHTGSEGNFEKFSKDGKNYRIDRYDEKHQMQLEQ